MAATGDDDARHRATGVVGFEAGHLGTDEERHVRQVEDGTHRDGLGVGLGVHQARVAVAPRATDARALRPVGLVEQYAARRVERVIAALLHLVREFLHARLVRHRRPGIRLRAMTLRRILAAVAVDLIQRLGLAVPRLEVVVAEGPRR